MSWLLSGKVLLNLRPSCITLHPVCESTIVLQGVVAFLTILHDISPSLWVNCHFAKCYWISDHLAWHFFQRVSWPWSCKVLVNFWPSGTIFCTVCESTIILQRVVKFLTISHHISSSLWVNLHLIGYCWISDPLASHFIQSVSWPSSCKVLLNFWPPHITIHPGSESMIIVQCIVEFLTISHYNLSRKWVEHHLTRCCWFANHLAWHFVQFVSWLSSHKVLLNFWPYGISFGSACELTVILQGIVECLTMWHNNSCSSWVDHHLARCCWIFDHLSSHFFQFVSWPSSCKVLLNVNHLVSHFI